MDGTSCLCPPIEASARAPLTISLPISLHCYCSDTNQVVHCSTLQCPDRSTPIIAASRTKCRGNTCVASQCCEAKCSYHQCPASTTPMKDADGIVCPNLECTDDLCCEDSKSPVRVLHQFHVCRCRARVDRGVRGVRDNREKESAQRSGKQALLRGTRANSSEYCGKNDHSR